MNMYKWVPESIYDSGEGQPSYSHSDYAPSGPWDTIGLHTIPKSLRDSMKNSIMAAAQVRRNVIGPEWGPNGRFTGYASVIGTPDPKPADVVNKFTIKRKAVINANFSQRVKAGEIVVAPYTSDGEIAVKLVAGQKDFSSTADYDYLIDSSLASSAGFVVAGDRWYYTKRHFIIPGEFLNWRMRRRKYVTRWVMPTFYSPKEIFDRLKDSLVPDIGLVTQVWADNNKKRMDFLTAMAEMPRALSSFLDALGYLGTLIKDFKRRRFFLNKAHQRIRNKLGVSYAERRLQILSKYDRKIASARKPAVILRLRQRKEKALKALDRMRIREEKKMVREFATQAASLWLSFRYEIMPLYYQSQDVLDVIANSTSEFMTSRDSVVKAINMGIPLEWNLDQENLVSQPKHKVMVKSKLSPDNNIGKTLSANPFTTAWELLTLSFVVDWFVNFGDVIAGFTGGYSDESGTTASWRFDDKKVFRLKDTPSAMAIVNINFYTRKVIDPRMEGGLACSPDLNLFRYLDAMSLSWNRSRLKISRAT